MLAYVWLIVECYLFYVLKYLLVCYFCIIGFVCVGYLVVICVAGGLLLCWCMYWFVYWFNRGLCMGLSMCLLFGTCNGVFDVHVCDYVFSGWCMSLFIICVLLLMTGLCIGVISNITNVCMCLLLVYVCVLVCVVL